MKRLDWIVLGVCVLCLYAVIQIRVGCFWCVGSFENAEAINSIIEGLSYSYIAAYLFYILTSFLPAKRRKRMLAPIIRERVRAQASIFHILRSPELMAIKMVSYTVEDM